MTLKSIRKYTEEMMEDDVCQRKQESKEMYFMWIYLQIVLWICHMSNFSTQDVLHLFEYASDVTSFLLSYIWCQSTEKLIRETDSWTLSSATLFTGKKIQSGVSVRIENTEMKHLIFHVVVFLCFFVSLFDLICSFGLVGTEQLIQQTWLRRCEACTQI